MANNDLENLVDVRLGTGCREGEALAIRPRDLIDLEGPVPMLRVSGTLVEPRKGFVDELHRQDTTKTRDDQTLILPSRVVEVLRRRIERDPPPGPDAPVFATRTGNWLQPANMRTRLRRALDRTPSTGPDADTDLTGTTFHTLRRTVGTLIAHEVSLDAARDQLGHRDPSVTFQHYVGKRSVAPDLRGVPDRFFEDLPSEDATTTRACRDASSNARRATLTEQLLRPTSASPQPPLPGSSHDASPRRIGR